jgi:glycosyltransferase involved in cell wall biosynthesis
VSRSRLTVCHVTSVHVPTDSRILYHECRSLATRYRTLLVARDDAGPRTIEGVEIVTLPRARGRLARFVANGKLAREAVSHAAQLYHFHDPELISVMAAFAEASHVPVVYDAHEDYPAAMTQKAWIPGPLRPLAARWAERTEAKHVGTFSAVVVADEAMERRFAAMHPRVVRLDNYPPLSLFPPAPARPEGPPTLVYVGSVSAVRGFFEMVDVVRAVRGEFPDARLVVHGRPTEEVSSALPRVLSELPEGALEMRGPVPYGEIASVLAEAHVGLSLLRPHPKYDANVSMKVFDYMAAGLPWVASDFAPLRAATRDGVGGTLVAAGDVEAASAAVLELLRNRTSARDAAAAGRALCESDLSWERVEPRLFALYEELLSEGTDSRS